MRKTAAIVMALAMLASFALVAVAEEAPPPVLPGDVDFPALIALEKAQSDVTEDVLESALQQNEFANRRVEDLGLALASEKAKGFGAEVLMQLLAVNEENLGQIIAGLAKDKELSSGSMEVLVVVEVDAKERGWRLEEIVEEETLPEGAVAGAERALANMEAAAERAAAALENGEAEGPPGDGLPEDSKVPDDVPVGRP